MARLWIAAALALVGWSICAGEPGEPVGEAEGEPEKSEGFRRAQENQKRIQSAIDDLGSPRIPVDKKAVEALRKLYGDTEMQPVEIVWTVLQIIGVIAWTPDHKKAEQLVFQTKDELVKVWTADGGKTEEVPARYDQIGEIRVFDEGKKLVPEVDFNRHTVLAVFSGEKPSGGYDVKIEKVLESDDKKKVAVLYRESAPPAGMGVIAVLTYPKHVVVVKKITGKVSFLRADSDEAKAIEAKLKPK